MARLPSHFLEMALDSCRDLVFVKNDNLEIIFANRSALDIQPPEKRDDVIGYTTAENFSETESNLFLRKDREALETGFSQAIEKIVDFRGRNITLVTNKTRFFDEEGNAAILGISTDVSALIEQTDRLTQSNGVLEKFASLTAHDLAAPIGTASLMLQTLQLNPAIRDNARARESIEEIADVLRSSARKISSMLILQKAILTRHLECETVDFGLLVGRVGTLLKASIDAESAQITHSQLPVLRCQPLLAETLIQNLIENSLKYHGDDLPVITVSHIRTGDRDVISVTDNGQGMSEQERLRVFTLFQQGDGSTQGLGVGLALCKDIVDVHGGRIWIDRDYRTGTRISFTLSPIGSLAPGAIGGTVPERSDSAWRQVPWAAL